MAPPQRTKPPTTAQTDPLASEGTRSTFKKLERQRLSHLVVDQIEEAVISGASPVGTRLPPEQALADQFGVSRNVVREALKILQERRLIEIRNGSGAFVAQPNPDATSSALGRYMRFLGPDAGLVALYEARKILEGSNARLAAERADARDLQALSACLDRMRLALEEGSVGKWSEADLDFHVALARATHNPFLGVLLEPLVDQLRGVISEGFLVKGGTESGIKAHTRIFACIKKQDATGAYRALMEHLQDSEQRVLSMQKG